jgi:hypothetical protein
MRMDELSPFASHAACARPSWFFHGFALCIAAAIDDDFTAESAIFSKGKSE